MPTDEHLEEYARMVAGIKAEGAVAYAVAVVMPDGRLVRGGNFGSIEQSSHLATSLRESLSNIKSYQRSSAAA